MEDVENQLNVIKPTNKTKIDGFLPRNTAGFYRYNGSLTTPNCTESVIWTVFTSTIPISKTQVKITLFWKLLCYIFIPRVTFIDKAF